jgi:hypothetical protein
MLVFAAMEALPGVVVGLVLLLGVAPVLALKRRCLAEIASRLSPSGASADAFSFAIAVMSVVVAVIGIGWVVSFL